MKFLFLSLFFFAVFSLFSQPTRPIDYGLKSFQIIDKHLGSISFYVDTTSIAKKAPLFVDVNGSGGLPLCLYVKGKGFDATSNTFSLDVLQNTKQKYHYVIIDKPGTPFCDTVKTTSDAENYNVHKIVESYNYSSEYTKRLSLNWRVEATKKVISYLIQHKFWDHTKLVAHGYSEGGQVVASLAVSDKRITHIAVIAGSGLNQFYDAITGWRIKAATGNVTQEQAQDSILNVLKKIADVYHQPNATNKDFGGHSYLRWASFGSVAPFEQLRKLKIPIYMIAATNDESSPIYSLDYVLLEFLRLRKTNLTYDVCMNCDHYLTSAIDGNIISQNYLVKILSWINEH